MQSETLYGEQTEKTLENMSFSGRTLQMYPEYTKAMAQVKEVCAEANFRAGQMTEETCRRIQKACQAVAAGQYAEQFPVDVFHGGGGIGLNMNMNEVLASLAGEGIHPVEDINRCQSTSDVCHTALRIALLELTETLLSELTEMEECLKKKAGEAAGIRTIARTCWQDGMQVEVSELFRALEHALARRRASLEEQRKQLYQMNLGWTVIGSGTGSTEGYRREIQKALQEVTGKPFRWCENPYDAAQYPDDLGVLSGELRLIASLLVKFSQDLRLLSSGPETGLGELKLPALQAGSSFFPGKVNPVVPEMMIQCGMLMAGNDSVIQSCVAGGEGYINLWEELMGFLLMDNVTMLTRTMRLLRTKCIEGTQVNREVCERYASCTGALVTRYKEKYGYAALSGWIKKEGPEAVGCRLREEEEQ